MKLRKHIFDVIVDLFSGVLLWLFIWGGVVLSFLQYGESLLGVLAFFSGVAWVYRDLRDKKKRELKKKKSKCT